MGFFRHHNHTLNHNRNPPKEIKITMMITIKNVKPKPRRGGDGCGHGWRRTEIVSHVAAPGCLRDGAQGKEIDYGVCMLRC
jgi:hypothetical protein